jgi:dTDP-4-dehydrorhamnose reductase
MSGWLVTGAGGMLGRDLTAALTGRGETVTALARSALDVTDAAAVASALAAHRPDVVVNCAAWTAVDDAEAAENEAMAVNGLGPANLARACAASDSRLVQLSTDYVFAGTVSRPYNEDDPPAPRTAYGRTKLAGEQAVLQRLPEASYVVRTAWLYGAHGRNFVATMIRLAGERLTVDVVDDQHGQPTWTVDVAEQVIALVRSGAPVGIYHATSSGQTTWLGLAREIFRLLGTDPSRLRAIPSSALTRPAIRPSNSVLGHDAWARCGMAPIRDWRLALRRAFPDLSAARSPGTGHRREEVPTSAELQAASTRHVCHAAGIVGKQPAAPGFAQRRRGGVLLRQDARRPFGPGDADVGIEGINAVFAISGVGSGAQVNDRGLIADRCESMPESFSEEHCAPLLVVELYRLPATVAGRADPNVDNDVEDCPGQTRHILRLAGRDVREMNAPDYPSAGHRAVGLDNFQPIAEGRRELLAAEPLKKTSAAIVKNSWRDDPRTIDPE